MEILDLTSVRNHEWHIEPCVALTGQGYIFLTKICPNMYNCIVVMKSYAFVILILIFLIEMKANYAQTYI